MPRKARIDTPGALQHITVGGDSKKLNIASSTASESATRDRLIVEKQGLKLLDEDIE